MAGTEWWDILKIFKPCVTYMYLSTYLGMYMIEWTIEVTV